MQVCISKRVLLIPHSWRVGAPWPSLFCGSFPLLLLPLARWSVNTRSSSVVRGQQNTKTLLLIDSHYVRSVSVAKPRHGDWNQSKFAWFRSEMVKLTFKPISPDHFAWTLGAFQRLPSASDKSALWKDREPSPDENVRGPNKRCWSASESWKVPWHVGQCKHQSPLWSLQGSPALS